MLLRRDASLFATVLNVKNVVFDESRSHHQALPSRLSPSIHDRAVRSSTSLRQVQRKGQRQGGRVLLSVAGCLQRLLQQFRGVHKGEGGGRKIWAEDAKKGYNEVSR